MKPYRLLSPQELEHISKELDKAFKDWNSRFAQFSLKFTLQKAPISFSLKNPMRLNAHGLVEKDIFSVLSMSVFGEIHEAFEPISQHLAKTLFEGLLCQENIEIEEAPTPRDWLYKGSTCLLLEIFCEDKCISCLLSPEWVQAQLSHAPQLSKAPLTTLNEALKEHTIPLKVTLNPIRLPLKHILNMQKGDLIKTDQNLNDAFCLIQGDTNLAYVQLGHNKTHKSIVIRSST